MDVFYTMRSGLCRSSCYKFITLFLCLSLLLGMVIPAGATNTSDNTDINIDNTISGTPSGSYNEKDVFYISLPQGITSFTLTTTSGMAATTTDDGTDSQKQGVAIAKGDSNYNAAKTYYETAQSKITGIDTTDGDFLLFRVSTFDLTTFSVVIRGYIVVSFATIPEKVTINMDNVIANTPAGSYNGSNVFHVSVLKETTSFTLSTTSSMAATTTDDGTDSQKQGVAIAKGDSNYNAAKAYYETAQSKITGIDATTGDNLFFRVSVFDFSTFSVVVKGYIVVSWEKGESTELTDAQKAPLSNLLNKVADGNSNYYLSNDRYNGKKADTITSKRGSFWATFTAANGPRDKAQNILDTATTVDQITAAVAELETAISKLIPTSQLNATYLYETVQWANGYTDEALDAYTSPSVKTFLAARSAAQRYLDSLFNADGSAKEDVNIVANQQTADDYADALKNSGLVSKDSVEESKVNLRTIQALAKKYSMTENGGKYTDESWTAFENARKAAVDYAANYQVSENMSSDDTKQYASRTRAFLSAAYGLTPVSGDITVAFSFTDDLHLRVTNIPPAYVKLMKDPDGDTPQIKTITLPAGSTLADLWKQTGCQPGNSYLSKTAYSIWYTFVNDTMLYGATPGVNQYFADTNYVLKDGDEIHLAHMEWPSYTFNYIYRDEVNWANMTDALSVLRFKETGAQNAAAGEETTLTVERTSAHLWTYTGS